jgi:hypothetical protein
MIPAMRGKVLAMAGVLSIVGLGVICPDPVAASPARALIGGRSAQDEPPLLFPDTSLSDAQQAQADVDAGHQPWRVDPAQVALAYGQSVGFTDPQVTDLGDNRFRVTDRPTARLLTVVVVQPVRTGPTGIWEITAVSRRDTLARTGTTLSSGLAIAVATILILAGSTLLCTRRHFAGHTSVRTGP